MNTTRNEIKARIVGTGLTMQETLDRLHRQYGWSDSASNFSNKLQRNSLRYREAVELADVIGYELKCGGDPRHRKELRVHADAQRGLSHAAHRAEVGRSKREAAPVDG